MTSRTFSARIHRVFFWFLLAYTLVRGAIAAMVELGNDEVYYWTYALFPALSYFDHPPMVGIFIRIFSFNLSFEHEFFIRLSAILSGSANLFLIFLIGKKLKNALAGWYAALLYAASVYTSVIAGLFILPDTPLLFFFLLALLALVKILQNPPCERQNRKWWVLFGIFAGLAAISKYSGAVLWFAAGLYLLFFESRRLKNPFVYVAALLSLLCLLPLLLWNIENDFVSFRFHGNRVSFLESGFRPDYFAGELFGQIFYNNPINFVLIAIALVAVFRQKAFPLSQKRLLLLLGLPLPLLFLFFSLFRRTLPHWSAPGYIALMLLAALYFAQKQQKLLPTAKTAALGLLALVLLLGVLQIRLGIFDFSRKNQPIEKLGKYDATLTMYGWQQLAEKFAPIKARDQQNQTMPADAPIVSHNWFPAAHLDFYVARPLSMKLFAVGELKKIHHYAWINHRRGMLKPGSHAYFITTGSYYTHPREKLAPYFETIQAADTIPIVRGGKIAKYAFVFRLKNCIKLPEPEIMYGFGER